MIQGTGFDDAPNVVTIRLGPQKWFQQQRPNSLTGDIAAAAVAKGFAAAFVRRKSALTKNDVLFWMNRRVDSAGDCQFAFATFQTFATGTWPDAVAVAPGGTEGRGVALVANLDSNTVTPVDLGLVVRSGRRRKSGRSHIFGNVRSGQARGVVLCGPTRPRTLAGRDVFATTVRP